MTRTWIVCTLLVAAVSDARASTRCSCSDPVVFPRPGTENVPLNSAIFTLNAYDKEIYSVDDGQSVLRTLGMPREYPGTHTGVTDLSFSHLSPNSEYRVEGPTQTTFRTGWQVDLAPPAPPVIHTLTLSSEVGNPFDEQSIRIDLDASESTDTALLLWTIEDDQGRSTSFATTADDWPKCDGVFARSGPATIQIVAVDLAGNRSEPVTLVAMIAPQLEDSVCRFPGYFKQTARQWRLACEPALIVMVILLAIIMGRRLRASREHDGAEAIALLVIELAARRRRARSILVIGLGCPALALTWGLVIVPFAVALLIAVALQALIISSAVLGLVEANGVAHIRGSSILIRAANRCIRFKLTRSQLARARKQALPTASMLEHVR